ncbi:hypothetical protein [Curtobacterium sp. MCPF17_052]|uniref:hypothetical protein n=1 Tax=Curtobacterium sp. MCPF17_052 TaxID=2175655 RepID=UPI0034644BE0
MKFLVDSSLLPLASVIIEPAKVFFLNNAINHGVLDQLGAQQVQESGKSILFLLEANPGPGLGILLAFTFFGVGIARSTAPGAILIQFFGGIHEIYFPYVLQKPILFVAVILGGATGVATNVAFQSGLVAPASPGSIIAVLTATAKDSYVGVILSVVLSAAVSFAVASFFLIASRKRDLASGNGGDMSAAMAKLQQNKGRDVNAATSGLLGTNSPANEEEAEASLGGRRLRQHRHGDARRERRLRLRRRHGLERHGCECPAEQDQEGWYRGCHGRQQGDREPLG